MAAPITEIHRHEPTEEEIKQQKLEELKDLVADHEDALNNIFKLIGEVNDIGVLEAANSMIQAKDKIAKIALDQISRDPVTNLINTLMGTTGALMKADPELVTSLMNSVVSGMDEGNKFLESNKKVGVMNLIKLLSDPDINRAVGFGISFLKGMGKALDSASKETK
ncbi:DUF1641 domain-containing protein [Heyndrickxia ginsengihumi]|uniref:DUF1641 domain-containing protein n=1 Tax=Heyndrickxia ginsengihumi TaxID=363870 RepID=A0A0A6VBB0_9BACI|nr:DUF1641 domain-containing protein [Heyndrickxia ginsengihumi]KHD85555.1 hypothetical protein NG54_08305 [Heyndrickxia ginsengihumi]MBE6185494.1 DUF1641 domain-containing protein [Bacillus sp. (in: firmicutes)]MCM3023103.1 DUF1641 domain-containing protein [Heyndrickxia ginsengihumi]NEY21349.1 DUF1641 domain-containing protein [Heyndrickxia ginsengihumi]